jgi:hypothetical protein
LILTLPLATAGGAPIVTDAIVPSLTTTEPFFNHLSVAHDDAGIGNDEVLRRSFGADGTDNGQR